MCAVTKLANASGLFTANQAFFHWLIQRSKQSNNISVKGKLTQKRIFLHFRLNSVFLLLSPYNCVSCIRRLLIEYPFHSRKVVFFTRNAKETAYRLQGFPWLKQQFVAHDI